MKQLLNLLPQKWPFRFLDHITVYQKGYNIKGYYQISNTTPLIKDYIPIFPASFITEGLAQLSVIFIIKETEPLQENEFPLLGSIKMQTFEDLPWNVKKVNYEISPIKIVESRAILQGIATVDDKVICKGELSVAKSYR